MGGATGGILSGAVRRAGLLLRGHSLGHSLGPPSAQVPGRTTIRLADRDVPVLVRRDARARRVKLRVVPRAEGVELVLPQRASLDEGLRFLRDKAGWVLARQAEQPARIPFIHGTVLPLRGDDHVVRHLPSSRGLVRAEEGAILVPGGAEFLARRLTDWLRREAARDLAAEAEAMGRLLGRLPASVAIRDTCSRWGSCTSAGRLSFSWRLLLAPPPVARYVVAHEVAHLRHMNHGPEFWATVARLDPGHAVARQWLRRNGALLHAYG